MGKKYVEEMRLFSDWPVLFVLVCLFVCLFVHLQPQHLGGTFLPSTSRVIGLGSSCLLLFLLCESKKRGFFLHQKLAARLPERLVILPRAYNPAGAVHLVGNELTHVLRSLGVKIQRKLRKA